MGRKGSNSRRKEARGEKPKTDTLRYTVYKEREAFEVRVSWTVSIADNWLRVYSKDWR